MLDNQNLSAADWTALSIATPTDPRLPLSGQPIPLYTLNTGKVGIATDNLYTYSTQNTSTYNGFEVTANLRRDKFILFGGVTTDRLVTSNCDGSTTTQDIGARGASARDNPNSLRFCNVTLATSGQPAGVFRTSVKASASYSFPYDIQVSGSFASIPGPRHQGRLHRDVRAGRSKHHWIDHWRGFDHRQPGRAELVVPRLSEPARPARR